MLHGTVVFRCSVLYLKQLEYRVLYCILYQTEHYKRNLMICICYSYAFQRPDNSLVLDIFPAQHYLGWKSTTDSNIRIFLPKLWGAH